MVNWLPGYQRQLTTPSEIHIRWDHRSSVRWLSRCFTQNNNQNYEKKQWKIPNSVLLLSASLSLWKIYPILIITIQNPHSYNPNVWGVGVWNLSLLYLGVQLMLHTHTHGFSSKVPKNVGIWSPQKTIWSKSIHSAHWNCTSKPDQE